VYCKRNELTIALCMASCVGLGLLTNSASAALADPGVSMKIYGMDAFGQITEHVINLNGTWNGDSWVAQAGTLSNGWTTGEENPTVPAGEAALTVENAFQVDYLQVSTNIGATGEDGRGLLSDNVSANLAVSNLSEQFQHFWAVVVVNLDNAIGPDSRMNGNVSASLFNTAFDESAFLQNFNNGSNDVPIYNAYIDGDPNVDAPVKTLWDSGFSLQRDFFGNATDNTSFTNETGPGGNSTIALRLDIDLSGGDNANVLGYFEIEAIPAPAALPAFAIFGMATARRRRRG
jgi:hypothetical protein